MSRRSDMSYKFILSEGELSSTVNYEIRNDKAVTSKIIDPVLIIEEKNKFITIPIPPQLTPSLCEILEMISGLHLIEESKRNAEYFEKRISQKKFEWECFKAISEDDENVTREMLTRANNSESKSTLEVLLPNVISIHILGSPMFYARIAPSDIMWRTYSEEFKDARISTDSVLKELRAKSKLQTLKLKITLCGKDKNPIYLELGEEK